MVYTQGDDCFYYLPINNPQVREVEPNRKLVLDHLPSILHGALVDADSLWPLIRLLVLKDGWYVNKKHFFIVFLFPS